MKVAIGADHAGYKLKRSLVQHLERLGHEVEDVGTDTDESVDYPDFSLAVAELVIAGLTDRGVLVCGTGVGVAIAANKIDGIRAATCNEIFTAEMARAHNDANIVTVGARVVGEGIAERIVETFLSTEFEGGRHGRRVGKIHQLE